MTFCLIALYKWPYWTELNWTELNWHDTTLFAVGKFVQIRRDCRQLVANSVHTADANQLGSWVASASAVCTGLVAYLCWLHIFNPSETSDCRSLLVSSVDCQCRWRWQLGVTSFCLRWLIRLLTRRYNWCVLIVPVCQSTLNWSQVSSTALVKYLYFPPIIHSFAHSFIPSFCSVLFVLSCFHPPARWSTILVDKLMIIDLHHRWKKHVLCFL